MERFEELYHEVEAGRLGCADAAMILGCSPRHFLRLRDRYDEDGVDGLRDRRVGRVSRHRAADAEVEELTQLYRDRYAGCNIRHFHELARRDHSLHRGYTWTRLALLRAGLVTPVNVPSQAPAHADAGDDDPSGREHAVLVWRGLCGLGGDARRCDERDHLGVLLQAGRDQLEPARQVIEAAPRLIEEEQDRRLDEDDPARSPMPKRTASSSSTRSIK